MKRREKEGDVCEEEWCVMEGIGNHHGWGRPRKDQNEKAGKKRVQTQMGLQKEPLEPKEKRQWERESKRRRRLEPRVERQRGAEPK